MTKRIFDSFSIFSSSFSPFRETKTFDNKRKDEFKQRQLCRRNKADEGLVRDRQGAGMANKAQKTAQFIDLDQMIGSSNLDYSLRKDPPISSTVLCSRYDSS